MRHQVVLSCTDIVLGAGRRQLLGAIYHDAHRLLKVFQEKNKLPMEIGLNVCSDREIQNLNSKFRNKNEPTDVLSFAMNDQFDEMEEMMQDMESNAFDPEKFEKEFQENEADLGESDHIWCDEEWDVEDTSLLGDVFISIETSERQAADYSKSVMDPTYSNLDEIRVLMVHGVLHLFGYDHEKSESEMTRMRNEEQRILKALNWKGTGLCAVGSK